MKKFYLTLCILVTSSSCYAKNVSHKDEVYFNHYKINSVKDKSIKSKDETRFVAFGDFGTGDANQYKVARAIEAKCKKDGCDFGLLLGDNIYYNGVKDVNDVQFKDKFEDPYKNLNFKFYATLGNHDYRGDTQAQIDYTKKSDKWIMPNRTYTFSQNNIDFFSIDSNAVNDKQEKSLAKGIKESQAHWKFVFAHHPRYSHGLHGDADQKLANMLDKTICNKVDMYLSGHDHDLEHINKTCGVNYMVSGGGGDGLRPVSSGKNTRFSKASFGFSWFKVTKDSIYFQFIDEKGNMLYD
ncbi:MAG: metallophosphoesterase, partial [Candidatus Sericytochromatia bacterium]|nr:metallophosphoesterase [Candidatus Sericytochromatia bacterium]